MRLQTILVLLAACLFVPTLLLADGVTLHASVDPVAVGKMIFEGKDPITDLRAGDKVTYKYDQNEMAIDKLDGTVMCQHPGEAKPFALQTGSTVEKGDILTVYDKSWVIFKDHKGDHIGLDGGTVISFDEFYIGGPDRQVRILLQRGTLFLKTSNCDSKQSFFEINTGSVVTAVGETQTVLNYDPENKEHFQVQYFRGKLSVIDKNNEYKFGVMPKIGSSIRNIKDKENTTDVTQTQLDYIPEWSELNWENGILLDKVPATIEELVNINYKRFFSGDPRLKPSENNILLDEAQKVPVRDR